MFDFIAKSSSIQMYIKKVVCYSKTNWWKANELLKASKKAKEKNNLFCPYWKP